MTTSEIKRYKALTPNETLETLASIADIQAEIRTHVRLWLHQPTPELDERFMAARQREAAMFEQVMMFDRRIWNQGRALSKQAMLKAAETERRRRRTEQERQRRAKRQEVQPEGEGI